jgi:hypothetical protein
MNHTKQKTKRLFHNLTILILIAMTTNHATIMTGSEMGEKIARLASHKSDALGEPMAASLKRVDEASASRLKEVFGKLPLSFEANHGQTDERVKFLSRGNGYTLFLTADEAALQLHKQTPVAGNRQATSRRNSQLSASSVLRMKLVGANSQAPVEGLEPLNGKVSYFLGDQPQAWQTNVASYGKVEYSQVYPGIDLMYYSHQGQLEYDFKVAPGADFKTIALDFAGADQMIIESSGDLVLQTANGDVRHKRPFVYQVIDGQRREIDGAYLRQGEHQIGFQIGEYNKNYPLVIDPVLSYATYFGGNGDEVAYDITVDASGNTYITGQTNSINFPGGAVQNKGGNDVFIAKLAPSGSTYSAVFFGGSGNEAGTSIAISNAGDVYIGGFTTSANFPKINAYDNSLNGASDAFVVKFNSEFSAFLYATYFGGSDLEDSLSIGLDAAQNIYISGRTSSNNVPMMNAAQPSYSGQSDAFVAKLNASGNTLLYSTYLGGSSLENPYGRSGIAIDNNANVFLAGGTYSLDFPRKNAFQQNKGENNNLLDDVFVTKLNTNAIGNASLVYSTYLGGSTRDYATDIAIDSNGNAYVTGQTASDDFPKVNPLQASRAGGFDAFLLKLNATGSALVYSTLLGSSSDDLGAGVKVNLAYEAFITGSVGQAIPGVNSLKPYNGGEDAFLAKVNSSGSAVSFFTYLGGGNSDVSEAIALDPAGNAYIAGITKSTNFAKVNAVQENYGGNQSDTFVARIETDTPSTTDPVIATVYISGKKLYVEGLNFDIGAQLYLNGQKQKKVFNDERTPTTRLYAAKAGKQIPPGATLLVQVQNTNGTISKAYFFTHGVQ